MSTEIEAKLKVDSLAPVAAKLEKLGARFIADQSHIDNYFDDPQGSIAKGDRALRLRCQKTDADERTLITYKGPKEKNNFKKRIEIETVVGDFESACALLEALGYHRAIIVEKKRQLWKLGICEIALDELPLLGTFVEIEGPDDREISEIQEKLDLKLCEHIPQSYADLTEQILRENSESNKWP